MSVLFALLFTVLFGLFIGWGIHWTLHQKWSGRLYRAHMNHHFIQYPPNDLTSPTYRYAGKDDAAFVFVPLLALIILPLGYLFYRLGASLIPLLVGFLIVTLIGVAHDLVHADFHLDKPRLGRFKWFQRLRALHFYHHHNLKKNLGILVMTWDRLLGSFYDPTNSRKKKDVE